MNYIDVTRDDLLVVDKVFSMTRMRELYDLYNCTDLQKAVNGILVTEDQYYAYERKIYDGMLLLGVPEGTPIPDNLSFQGIRLVIKWNQKQSQ